MMITNNPINIVASVGLALGAVFGLAGSVVVQPDLQAVLWAIDSLGLVMATALLALKYFRKGHDLVAAGFLVFAIGEAVLLSGTAAGPAGSVPSFAAGTGLWATALLLVSVPQVLATVARVLALISAFFFAIVAARIFWGRSTAADFRAFAVLRIPLPRHDADQFDLEPLARAHVLSGIKRSRSGRCRRCCKISDGVGGRLNTRSPFTSWRSRMHEEPQVESCEHQNDADIQHHSFPESASEEREIYTDYNGYHHHRVEHPNYPSAHFTTSSRSSAVTRIHRSP